MWVGGVRGGGGGGREGEPAVEHIITADLLSGDPITAQAWESCRVAADRMAQAGVGRMPVVSPENPRHVVGMLTRSDLLKARARLADEESHRERLIGFGPGRKAKRPRA